MTRSLIVEPEAEVEIAEAAGWYEARSPGRGLLRAVEGSLEVVQRNPYEYQAAYRDVRRAPVKRFPYGLMYVATEQEIVVVACIHGRRNPSRWKGRVP
jgi:plasmid stabilization system protein ParE